MMNSISPTFGGRYLQRGRNRDTGSVQLEEQPREKSIKTNDVLEYYLDRAIMGDSGSTGSDNTGMGPLTEEKMYQTVNYNVTLEARVTKRPSNW